MHESLWATKMLQAIVATQPPADQEDDRDNVHPDGPGDPGTFWWRGREIAMQKTPWRVVAAVWNASHRTMSDGDVMDAVWGDAWQDSNDWKGRLRKAVHHANNALTEKSPNGQLLQIHRRNGLVRIVEPAATTD
jgi:hypothetical protein